MNRDDHWTPDQIEGFLLHPESLPEEEFQVLQEHLKNCALCSEHLERVKNFYDDLKSTLKEPPSDKERSFAESLLSRKQNLLSAPTSLSNVIDAAAELIEINRPTLPQRFFRYFKIHPVRSISFAFTIAAVLAAASMYLKPTADKNPYFVRIENSVMYVYNKEGNVIWEKSVPGMPDASSNDLFDSNRGEKRYLNVCDIDGDGRNVVLLSGSVEGGNYSTDSLYCFNSDGSMRWVTGTKSDIVFGKFKDAIKSKWRIIEFTVVNVPPGNDTIGSLPDLPVVFNKSETQSKPHLYAITSDVIFPFSKFIEIDPKSGKVIQSFTHPGRLEKVINVDLNENGKREIILGGISMAYRRACIAVLDPLHFGGAGPTRGDYTSDSSAMGTEMYYVLLPLTDVGKILGMKHLNYTQHLVADSDGTFIAKTVEAVGAPIGGSVFYKFGAGMNVMQVYFDEGFEKLRNELISEGKIKSEPDSTYAANLKSSILYWDGEKFVDHDVINRKYQLIREIP